MKDTIVFKIDPNHPDKKIISDCAKAIRDGGLVAFPTETVYGLAASLLDEDAIEDLYKVKGRPRNKPFTVHAADTGAIEKMGCRITRAALMLMDEFWPGPLTMILKSKTGARIGFRMPANKVALDLLRQAQVPVVAPSANISGARPPKTAKDVLKELKGKIDIVIDAGRTDIGVESTVIDLTVKPPKILREGAIRRRQVEKVLNP